MKMVFRDSCAEHSLGVGIYILFILFTILIFEHPVSKGGEGTLQFHILLASLSSLILLWLTGFKIISFIMPDRWVFDKKQGKLIIRSSELFALPIYREYPLQDVHDVTLKFEKRDAPLAFGNQKRPPWTYYVGLLTLKVAKETITAPYGSWNIHRQLKKVNKLRKFLALSPPELEVNFSGNVFKLAGYFFLNHFILLSFILLLSFLFVFKLISHPILKDYVYLCLFLECGFIICATFDLLHLMVSEVKGFFAIKPATQVNAIKPTIVKAINARTIEPKPPVMEPELSPIELKPGAIESEPGTIEPKPIEPELGPIKLKTKVTVPDHPDSIKFKPKMTETEQSSLSHENIQLVKPISVMEEGKEHATEPDELCNGNKSTKETIPLLVSLSLYMLITIMFLRVCIVLFGFLFIGLVLGMTTGGIITAAFDEMGQHSENMMGYITTIMTLIFTVYLIQYQKKSQSLTELFFTQIMFDLFMDQKRKLKSFTYKEKLIFLVLAPFVVVYMFLFVVLLLLFGVLLS